MYNKMYQVIDNKIIKYTLEVTLKKTLWMWLTASVGY